MMNKTEKAEKILNNMLEIYNLKNDCEYTFKTLNIDESMKYGCFASATVNEKPFFYFSVYMSDISDYFIMEIYEKRDSDRVQIFRHTNN